MSLGLLITVVLYVLDVAGLISLTPFQILIPVLVEVAVLLVVGLLTFFVALMANR